VNKFLLNYSMRSVGTFWYNPDDVADRALNAASMYIYIYIYIYIVGGWGLGVAARLVEVC